MTQHERILRHLKSGYTLTQAEAFTEYGIGRLSSRICELRKLGYSIKGEFVTQKNRYGSLFLLSGIPWMTVGRTFDNGSR